jgi:hypothetical protein
VRLPKRHGCRRARAVTTARPLTRDEADPRILHDEITVIDHALTRLWIVDKKYLREPNPRPDWNEAYCTENRSMIAIGKDNYFLSGDGMLMPVRKDQAPPDLRYFKQTRK